MTTSQDVGSAAPALPPSDVAAPAKRRIGWRLLGLTLLLSGLIIAVVGGLLLGWMLPRSASSAVRGPLPTANIVIGVVFLVITSVLIVRLATLESRAYYLRYALPAAGVALLIGYFAYSNLLTRWQQSYSDATGPVLIFGCLVFIIGLAVGIAGVGQRWATQFTPRTVSAALVLVLLVLGGSGWIADTAEKWPIRSQPAVGPVTVPGAPATVSGANWTRAIGGVTDVATGGPGLLVVQNDTVTGIDGATGAQVWTYRRINGGPLTLAVSPDGSTAYLAIANTKGTSTLVTALDAATGTARFEMAEDLKLERSSANNQVFATAFSESDFAPSQVRGWSATDGGVQWTYRLSMHCWLQRGGTPVAVDDTFVIAVECDDAPGPRVRVDVVDQVTGELRWSWQTPPTVQTSIYSQPVRVRADERLAVVTGELLRPAAGTEPRFETAIDLTRRQSTVLPPSANPAVESDLALCRAELVDVTVTCTSSLPTSSAGSTVTVTATPKDGAAETSFDIVPQVPGTKPHPIDTALLAGAGGAYIVAAAADLYHDTGGNLVLGDGWPHDVSITALR
ncbi:MAG: PQQ-binding-like beta-propeller repeat protein [Nakamurella sp.]